MLGCITRQIESYGHKANHHMEKHKQLKKYTPSNMLTLIPLPVIESKSHTKIMAFINNRKSAKWQSLLHP